jgi:thymidylate kinase
MFVTFEGCDGSGKSTLSVKFAEYLNNSYRDEFGLLKLDPHLGDFIWTKEPLFTTEEADRLNSPECKDQFKREALFFESRMNHQEAMIGKNIICDRYIWTGLAYSTLFSPACFDFAKELYLNTTIFLQPDLYIFVDTPIEVCHNRRDGEVSIDRLNGIRNAYLTTMGFLKSPIITISNEYEENVSFQKLIESFDLYVKDHYGE